MTLPDVLQFVDSISASPTVRLDLNDDATWSLSYEGTDLSPPGMRYAQSATMLVDGERTSAAVYENRQLKLRLDLITSTVDGQATELQKLWRELDRKANFIRWQPTGATQPVFFRTIRSSDNRVTDYPGAGTLRTVDVVIKAEPFALGLKEVLSQVTVNVDPAAGSNGSYFDVTGIKGDVETPLCLAFDPSDIAGVLATGPWTSAIAVRRRGTVANTPYVRQAEALTLGTDTTLPGNDAAMSGAGSNYARVSFATASAMAKRLSGYAAGTGTAESVDYRGTYRVYAQVRHSVASDVISVQLAWGFSSTVITNSAVTLPAETELGMVDLGLIQMPTGPDPVHDGYSGVEMAVKASYIEIDAQRVSGTGTLDIDYLLLVPADDRLLLVKWPGSYISIGTPRFVVDGAHEMVYGSDISQPDVSTTTPPQVTGGFPQISPNVTNRIFFVRDINNAASADTVGDSTIVNPWYWPRYLYVRPATS
jgi:hypothetical protein